LTACASGQEGSGGERRRLEVALLGRVPYLAAVRLQEALRRRILDGDASAERLLLLEHDPVITLGRSARPADILATRQALAAHGIAVCQSSRGGAATYHGPGQLVAYPVVRLAGGVVAHVQAMAAAVIEVSARFGIEAHFRRDRPGVWVGDRKLAAFGVHVHRRVAIHGLALNVDAALDGDGFDLIVPCGQPGARPVSLSELAGTKLETAALAPTLAAALARALGRLPVEEQAPSAPELLSLLAPVE
jgi:lipoate-protein ligase B